MCNFLSGFCDWCVQYLSFGFRDVDEVVRQSQINDGEQMIRSLELVWEKVEEKTREMQAKKGLKKRKSHEFKQPELDKNITEFGMKRFAPQSRRKIVWAVNLYGDWRRERIGILETGLQILNANLDKVYSFVKSDLCYSLSRFVREVKKLDGTEHPPNTVRELVIMIQMYLHEKGIFWKLLDEGQFVTLCDVVDNTMKERHSAGLGVRKSSDIISLEHKSKMFNLGILGDSSPIQLLRTVIYMIGMHCALRGGLNTIILEGQGVIHS